MINVLNMQYYLSLIIDQTKLNDFPFLPLNECPPNSKVKKLITYYTIIKNKTLLLIVKT